MKLFRTSIHKDRVVGAAKAFILNLCIALVIFVPFIIQGGGLFTLGDDFDAQELAFNIFANREIKAGNVFFNWAIDIGSDFIASFSFYNLGSPFFWITLPFAPETFPWLVGWILILKYAFCGLFSWLWLERHVGGRSALLGSVFYTFSGFQAMNLIFYHFHDVVTFFPLLLLGFDRCAEENRRGVFALAVGLNALVNWNFFIGEVIFLLFYYLVRCDVWKRVRERAWRDVGRQLLRIFGEGVLGVGIAAVLFVPTVLIFLSQDRVTDSILLSDALAWSSEDVLRNIRAVLLPAEPMNNNAVLSEMNWYSAGAYLPLVGVSLTAAYLFVQRGRRDWLSRLLWICVLLSAVPVLNNVFVFFNREPYRRWYYMPILLMALASARMAKRLQERDRDAAKAAAGAGFLSVCLVLLLAWALRCWRWSAAEPDAILLEDNWAATVWAGLGGLLLTLAIIWYGARGRHAWKLLLFGAALWGWLTHTLVISAYRDKAEYTPREVYNKIVHTAEGLESDVLPYRYAILDNGGYFNSNMGRSLTSIDSFISTVDPGIFEFYDAVGTQRHNLTPTGPMGTDRLLSVKYFVTSEPAKTGFGGVAPLTILNSGNADVYVFDDYYAQPIGFAYSTYITRSEFDAIPVESRVIAMLNDLVVRDEDEEIVRGVLTHVDAAEYASRKGVIIPAKDIKARDQSHDFYRGRRRFRSWIWSESEQWAFFSVPWSDRWSVKVNGVPRQILDINGLMAVPITAGENEIEFTYRVWVNILSAIVSLHAFAAAVFLWWRDARGCAAAGGQICRKQEGERI